VTTINRDPREAADPIPAPQHRVLIADDHPLIIAGIRRMLDHLDDIEVVGEARSGPELMRLVERRSPRVVLLDLRMPGVAGFEAIEQIREAWPEIKIVVMSASDNPTTIDGALRAGAHAYLVKTAATDDLTTVLRRASSGAAFRAPAPPARDRAAPANLTSRERTVLAAVTAGLTTAAISRDLLVSEHTVKFHLTHIYRKLGVSNRAGAVRCALEQGLAAA